MKVIIQRVVQGCVKVYHIRKFRQISTDKSYFKFLTYTTKSLLSFFVEKYVAFKSLSYSLSHMICFFLMKEVKEEIISSIGKGLVVLVGISENDTENDINYITKKILNIRFFDDENGKKWSKSVMDKQYEVLCVSQFTLCHNLRGNRLDFHCAMNPSDALIFYENFLDKMKKQYKPEMIQSGKFGAYCQVELMNDGPVTISLESKTDSKTESKDCL